MGLLKISKLNSIYLNENSKVYKSTRKYIYITKSITKMKVSNSLREKKSTTISNLIVRLIQTNFIVCTICASN